MKKPFQIAQLFLRLALGLGFILPVMDRMGWLGVQGQNGNAWGNWSNFRDYTALLLPFLTFGWVSIMAVLATLSETILGFCLILGLKIRWAAWGSFLLLLAFGLAMFFSLNYRAPFNYSVFTASAAALLLALIPEYKWKVIS